MIGCEKPRFSVIGRNLVVSPHRDKRSEVSYLRPFVEKSPPYLMVGRYFGSALGRFISFDGTRLGVDRRSPQSWNGYPYVLNNPIGKIDPNGLYETNFHQGMTYFLAKQAGFSESEARTISKANEAMDHGDKRPTKMFGGEDERHSMHGFEADRGEARAVAMNALSLGSLGGALHHFQDTFSHQGFSAETGHLTKGHRPDKTSRDPAKALDAALQSFDILDQKAAEMGKQGFGAPDQDLLTAMANSDANVKDYDPASGSLTLEVDADKAQGLVDALKKKGYKVRLDGVEQN